MIFSTLIIVSTTEKCDYVRQGLNFSIALSSSRPSALTLRSAWANQAHYFILYKMPPAFALVAFFLINKNCLFAKLATVPLEGLLFLGAVVVPQGENNVLASLW